MLLCLVKCNKSGRGYLRRNATDLFQSSYGRVAVRRAFSVHIQITHWLRTQTERGRRKYREIIVRRRAKPFLSNPETFNVCFGKEEILTIYSSN